VRKYLKGILIDSKPGDWKSDSEKYREWNHLLLDALTGKVIRKPKKVEPIKTANKANNKANKDISTIQEIDTKIHELYGVDDSDTDRMYEKDYHRNGKKDMPLGYALLQYYFVGKTKDDKDDFLPFFKDGKGFDTLDDDVDAINEEFKDYRIYTNTGCGNNDCLILSFLMGVSPLFRKLSEAHKCEFSNNFRRVLLPAYLKGKSINNRTDKTMNEIIDDLESKRFLYDNTIGLLSDIYKIKFLVFETAKRGVMGKEKQVQPPYIENTGKEYSDVIIIINFNNGHYEVIGEDNKYVFTNDSAKAIQDDVDRLNPFNKNF
jgi:hypothetical protein